MSFALQVKGITKQFPGVLANDHVDFDLEKGEIHALLGENGAGKSTLMNVIYGLYRPDEGEIWLDGQKADIHSSKDAIAHGIGMVHQHFMLIPVFTVAENIMLGSETLKGGFLDRRSVAQRVRELSHQYGLDVNPHAYIRDLPVGVQQRVEIVKALYRKADVLILDEPTAVLTPQEAEDLFRIMRGLASQGISIIFISHKLKEVLSVSDRITVMRDGKVVGSTIPQETNQARLAAMMVGREVILTVEKQLACLGPQVLDVQDLHVFDDRGVEAVRGASLSICAGEILGIAGVQGNGQTELVEALTGLRPVAKGQIAIGGKTVIHTEPPQEVPASKLRLLLELFTLPRTAVSHTIRWLIWWLKRMAQSIASAWRPAIPRQILESQVAHIPEDRQKRGLVLSCSITDNMVLCSYYQSPFARNGILNHKTIDENGRALVKKFDVRTPSPYIPASKLSGGNQQKVIVARELSRSIKLIIASQPTRGLDVGSIEYIHRQIIEMRDAGCAVLLVSAELDEIMSLSDRIAVMYDGRIVATLLAQDATKEQLGLLMAGVEGTQAVREMPGQENS